MDTPLIYICILNWNGCEDTAECLDSLQLVDYPNYRVVVVDNGSEDGSYEKLRREYPRVIVLETERNLGFSGGNNVGIRYALEQDADYVFLLNNDTVADTSVLDRLIEVSESDERIGIVGPAIYCYPQKNLFWAAGMEKTVPNGKIFPHYSMRGKGEIDRGQYSRVEDVDMINGCALLIKRKVIEETGLLNEKYFAYNEDSDWNDRVAGAGYRIVYVPGAKVWHKGSVSFGGECSPSSWFYTVRNELFFIRKRANWVKLPKTYFDYIRENFWFWKGFKSKGDKETADAVLDGIWCALTNKGGIRSVQAPRWFERIFNWKMRRDNSHGISTVKA